MRRTIGSMRGVGGSKTLPQLLIANYAITRKALGPYELDEVEAAVELTPSVAADLDLARVLAKALAQEAVAPLIIALARELDRLDAVSDERAAALTRELLPIGDRLVLALDASIPDLASVLHDAKPSLEVLAKGQASRGDTTRMVVSAPSSPCTGSEQPAGNDPAVGATDTARARLTAALAKRIPLLKTDEERYILGIVLEPETVDAQDDIYSAAEVREAAHRFMEQYQNIGLMHQGLVNSEVKILESYLAPTTFELSGAQVRKGTWLLAIRVLDDGLWGQIKSGELTGLSIGGSAVRNPA